MLSDHMPGLKYSQPGNIQEETLPELRNFVAVDNKEIYKNEIDELNLLTGVKCCCGGKIVMNIGCRRKFRVPFIKTKS